MKVGILALVLLVDIRGVEVEAAELLEDFPEVARRKLRVDSVVKFCFMSSMLAYVAPSFNYSASDQSMLHACRGTIRILALWVDRTTVFFLCTVYKDTTSIAAN